MIKDERLTDETESQTGADPRGGVGGEGLTISLHGIIIKSDHSHYQRRHDSLTRQSHKQWRIPRGRGVKGLTISLYGIITDHLLYQRRHDSLTRRSHKQWRIQGGVGVGINGGEGLTISLNGIIRQV